MSIERNFYPAKFLCYMVLDIKRYVAMEKCMMIDGCVPYHAYVGTLFLPRAHAQGVKQSVCPSVVVVVVVVGTKIARSRVLGVCTCCKHNQSVDIGEKLACTGFELLKKAY